MFKNKHVIILVILSIVTHVRWFVVGIFSYGDWWHTTVDTMQEWTSISHIGIWRSTMDFGGVEPQLYFVPMYFLRGLCAFLPHAEYWSLFLVYLLPMVIIAPVASFYAIRRFIPDDLSAFVGSVVYTFSTYFLVLQTAHLTIGCAYAFAPIFLLAIIYFLQDQEKHAIPLFIFAVVVSMSVIIEPRIFYILVLFLLPCLLFLRKLFWRFLIVGLLIILMNLFWALPLLTAGTSEVSAIIDRPLFGEQYRSLRHAITGMQPAWSWEKPTPFELQSINPIFWILPIFVFFGLYFLPRQSRKIQAVTLFMYVIALVGIFLGKQSHAPFADAYGWLHGHFPGFRMYRESSKFFVLVDLSYAYLTSFTLYAIFQSVQRKKIAYVIKYGLASLLVGISLMHTMPLMTGRIGTMFIRRDIPRDYSVYRDFIESQDEFFRIQGIPQFPRWASYTTLHPKVDVISVIEHGWKNFINSKQKPNDRYYIEELFNANYIDYLLDASSIKYVFVPVRDKQNDNDFFETYGGKEDPNIRQWYIDLLDRVKTLQKVDIGMKDVVLYENANVKKYIRTLDTIYALNDMQNMDAKYDFVKTTFDHDFDIVQFDETKKIPVRRVQQVFTSIYTDNIAQNALREMVTGDGENDILYVHKNIYDTNENALKNIIINDDTLQQNSTQEVDSDFVSVVLDSTNMTMREFVYDDKQHNYDNHILNASFDEGLWHEKVEDCNNYDDDALLDMSIEKFSADRENVLEFRATRHIACTHQSDIAVEAGSTYLFTFDSQSNKGEIIRYSISFDDSSYTVIDEKIPAEDDAWHTFTRHIVVPQGAKKMSLHIFGYSKDDHKTEVITRYDNFHFIALPRVQDRFYLMTNPVEQLSRPQEMIFDDVSPTKKRVHVKRAEKSFFLVMGEGYHDKWQMQFYNDKNDGPLERLLPFVQSDRISDEHHFSYMTFLNGWYVDVPTYCAQKDLCTKNADGTYDMELLIEFFPQRWFYVGVIISATIFILLCGVIVYKFCFYRSKKGSLSHI